MKTKLYLNLLIIACLVMVFAVGWYLWKTTDTAPEAATEPQTESMTTQTEPAETVPIFQEALETVWCTDNAIPVRTGPDVTYAALGELNRGDQVQQLGFSDAGWSQVAYGNQVGYVPTGFLSGERVNAANVTGTQQTDGAPFTYS